MKRWKNVVLFSIVMFIVLTTCACGSEAEKWQEQYDLGQQYLNDGNYEDAIIAYTEAIKIDEKQAPAYAGRGDAYNGLYTEIAENNYTPVNQEFADYAAQEEVCLQQAANDYSNAIKIEPAVTDYYEKIVVAYIGLDDSGNIELWLEQGYEQTQDSTLYENVIQIYIDAKDFDNAKHWLEKAYEETSDDSLNKKYEKEISQNNKGIIAEQEDFTMFENMLTETSLLWSDKEFDFTTATSSQIINDYIMCRPVPTIGMYTYFWGYEENSDSPNFSYYYEDPKGLFVIDQMGGMSYLLDADKADWIIRNVYGVEPDRNSSGEYYYYYEDNLYISGGLGGDSGDTFKIIDYTDLGDGQYGISLDAFCVNKQSKDEMYFIAALQYDDVVGKYWSINKYSRLYN